MPRRASAPTMARTRARSTGVSGVWSRSPVIGVSVVALLALDAFLNDLANDLRDGTEPTIGDQPKIRVLLVGEVETDRTKTGAV